MKLLHCRSKEEAASLLGILHGVSILCAGVQLDR